MRDQAARQAAVHRFKPVDHSGRIPPSAVPATKTGLEALEVHHINAPDDNRLEQLLTLCSESHDAIPTKRVAPIMGIPGSDDRVPSDP